MVRRFGHVGCLVGDGIPLRMLFGGIFIVAEYSVDKPLVSGHWDAPAGAGNHTCGVGIFTGSLSPM